MNITSSNRLNYKLIDESDSEFLYLLDQDPEVMRYINGGNMTSREDIKNKFIPRHNAYKNADKVDEALAIYKKSRPNYHSVTAGTIDEILGYKN